MDPPLALQIEYHKKFAEEKGHFTAIADDPETERAKRVAKQASQLQYTADSRQPPPTRPAEGKFQTPNNCRNIGTSKPSKQHLSFLSMLGIQNRFFV